MERSITKTIVTIAIYLLTKYVKLINIHYYNFYKESDLTTLTLLINRSNTFYNTKWQYC